MYNYNNNAKNIIVIFYQLSFPSLQFSFPNISFSIFAFIIELHHTSLGRER